MNTELIKELIGEFKGSDLTKLKLNCEGFELELVREKEIVCSTPVQMQTMAAPLGMPPVQKVVTTEEDTEVSSAQVQGRSITAPMVGTFYASSSPDVKPFLEIGKKVKKGDIVCILEAMKLMNEVESDIDGEVVEILVKNEEIVEFGQPMFIIK